VELMVKIRLNNVFLFLFYMKDFLMQNLNKRNRVFIFKKMLEIYKETRGKFFIAIKYFYICRKNIRVEAQDGSSYICARDYTNYLTTLVI
jgi:hypothetical protein